MDEEYLGWMRAEYLGWMRTEYLIWEKNESKDGLATEYLCGVRKGYLTDKASKFRQ